MNKLSLFFILSILISVKTSLVKYNSNNGISKECQILNPASKRIIYASDKFPLLSKRNINLKEENKLKASEKNQTIWFLEAVEGARNQTFYLRNKKYPNEYLRSTNAFDTFNSNQNYFVFVQKKQENSTGEFFMWTIEKSINTSVISFKNEKLGKPLYVRKSFSDSKKPVHSFSLNVWNGGKIESQKQDMFEWELKCENLNN